MTLSEAIKTGRPFRLPSGYWLIAVAGQLYEESGKRNVGLYRTEDLLSTEWMVKDPEVFLTDAHFEKIKTKIISAYKGREVTKESIFDIIAEELGLRKDEEK